MSRRRRPGQRGFTLLEVIVAFTILSIALVGLMRAFTSGLHGLGAAQASAIAVMHARSKLDEIGQTIPLEDGELTGDYDDGYRWRLTIALMDEPDGGEAAVSTLVPYRVEVTVTGERGGTVTLETMRLGEPE